MDICLICGKPVSDYEPEICCNGAECGCQGQPVNPCVCSVGCEAAMYDYIGMSFEDRRKSAGIEKWPSTQPQPEEASDDE